MSNGLDGRYKVSSTSNFKGTLEKRSDGFTEIRDGRTERRDGHNVLWTSTFRVLNENEVEMVSVADPADATPGFALFTPDGRPTLAPVTYHAVLKLTRKGEKIQMSGQIEYGNEIVFLTLRSADPQQAG